ncbi:P-loop NTPase family protein [Jiella marina]|uniref:hypothetical protein n=1 Tax=Jiella sp. LLJ827 TaxID=2917712 RepID=UPI002101BA54|nr:hypothetical protein [Jiella sp. LLJ827]MCQ0986290.1 hypothetical protein [Jiella sp. LLJ827]
MISERTAEAAAPVDMQDDGPAPDPKLQHHTESAKNDRSAEAEADEDGAAKEQIATSFELAQAVQNSPIVRLVVLSAHRAAGSFGGVELARRLVGAGHATVVIDLTPDDSVSRRLSLSPDCLGYADFLAGSANLAEIIHRDHYTNTHLVPSAGFDLSTADEAALQHLDQMLEAFSKAYDYTIIESDPYDVIRLPAILDETTAVVIAGLPHLDDAMMDVAEDVRSLGIEDIVFMPTIRRDSPA